MNDVISVLCPTRKRPANLARFLGSLVGTAAGIVEVMIYVDHDDVETITAMGLQVTGSTYRALGPRVAQVAVVGPRLPLAEACNIIAWASTGGIIHLAADDLVYRSRDWDDAVRSAFEKIPDRVALVYGRDGNQDERLATHPFLSRRWIDALGYAVPTQFPGVGGDVWLHDLARRIGRSVYLPDVFTEHLHWSFGKAEMDDTYREVEGRSGGHGDVLAASVPDRIKDAYKLMALKGTTP